MTLRLERDGPTGRLIIDRPEKRNAFTQAMWDALPRLIDEAVADTSIRVVILQSAAPGIFCAGADVGEIMGNKDDAQWRAANQAAINKGQAMLARANKPVIAMIDGDCVGAGCGLALGCDLRVATPRARFGITPAKLGLVYPLHDTKLLIETVGPSQAKRIFFTGQLLDAAEALRIGLIDMIEDSADTMAAVIAASSAHSNREMKRFVRRVLDGQVADDAETLAVFADAFTKPDFLEGVGAFLAKRTPEFK